MSVLTVCQKIAPVLGIEAPDAVMASTEQDSVSLARLAEECAERILDAHDWQALKRLETIAGDGSTTAWSLPSDFHRIPKDGRVWSTRIETPLTQIQSHDHWLELDIRSYEFVIGAWTILADQVLVKPTPTATESVKYYYQSDLIWNDGSNNIATPTADADTFRLDERLLRLCMIWQWKAYKGLPYAEDMANYQRALNERIERDRGPQSIVIGRMRHRRGMDIAYPQAITE